MSILKIFILLLNYWHRVTNITSFEKMFGKFFRSYSVLLSKFGAISFQEYVSKGITDPVLYGDLVNKLRMVKGEADFISLGSKIVKCLRRCQYDSAIIERIICLILGPNTEHSLSVALWLRRRLGPWMGLVLTSSETTGPWFPSPLIVSRDFFLIWTWARVQTAPSTTFFNGCPYIFLIYYYISLCMFVCVQHFYDLSGLVGCWSPVSPRRIIFTFLDVCPFDYTAVVVSGKVERS